MAKCKLVQANQRIAQGVTSGFQKISNSVVRGYQIIENGVVGRFTKLTDGFVDQFLTQSGESIPQAKVRLVQEEAARKAASKSQ